MASCLTTGRRHCTKNKTTTAISSTRQIQRHQDGEAIGTAATLELGQEHSQWNSPPWVVSKISIAGEPWFQAVQQATASAKVEVTEEMTPDMQGPTAQSDEATPLRRRSPGEAAAFLIRS